MAMPLHHTDHRAPGALVLLAAGGTGGHVFPSQALAEVLQQRGYRLAHVTDRRGGEYGDGGNGTAHYRIRAGRVTTGGAAARLFGAAELILGFAQSIRLLRRLRPRVVVGFGGYASVPVVMAAALLSVPVVVHEQNAVMGRANRLLAPRAGIIATSFAEVSGVRQRDRARTRLTGNPVRPAVAELADQPFTAPTPGGPVRVLVLGGSQGASVFAKVVPDAVARTSAALQSRIQLSLQCRAADLEGARKACARLGVTGELASFFDDVPKRLAQAHLVICRAGASTTAELTAAGRPAILVPYPSAMDDHQSANARAVAEAGGAEVIAEPDFTPVRLAQRLDRLLGDPGRLGDMARLSRETGQPKAAFLLADAVVELCRARVGEA